MAIKREEACAFTGHRPERLKFPEIKVITWIEDEIRKSIDNGYTTFISGMQRGVDIWAAEAVLELRDEGENVKLVAACTFEGMDSAWDSAWKKRYKNILNAADETIYVSKTPGRAAFFKRDHYMVDNASLLIGVYNGGGGGTLETIRYAEQEGIKIVQYKDERTENQNR